MQRVEVVPLTMRAPEVLLHAGAWTAEVPCVLDPERKKLWLPEKVLGALSLTPGQDVHVLTQDEWRHVRVGPLVGVWLSGPAFRSLRGARARAYAPMARSALAAGTVPVFFDLAGVDRRAGRVRGCIYRMGRFVAADLPLPDVIYNRATFPDRRERRAAAALRRELTDLYGTLWINPANAFGKWATYEALRFFPDTAHLAPETVLFDGPDSLLRMLSRHERLFLKADHGSRGEQVLRIQAHAGGWKVKGRCGRARVAEVLPDAGRLYAFLREHTGDGPWVLQQGIALPELNGRCVDVRAHTQKDGNGEWQVPVVLVRVGAPGEVVASTSQGGRPFSPEAFLERYGSRFPALRGVKATAAAVALQTAAALEARFGLQGEVAVDIGVDRSGRPWVFEANAKPLHRRLPWPLRPAALYHYPFRYAVYLAGRAWAGRHSALSWPVGPGPAEAAPGHVSG